MEVTQITQDSGALVSFDEFVSLPFEEVLRRCRPTSEEGGRIRAVVKRVICALQDLGPVKVVKGAPYGKGTHLRGFDRIDLLVLFVDFKPEDVHGELFSMQRALAEVHPGSAIGPCSLMLCVEGFKFNIFPGAFIEDEDCVMQEIGSVADPTEYVTHVPSMLLQVDFVKHQDARYKDLVRLCTVWLDLWRIWPEGSRLKSCLLELLALAAYQRASGRGGDDILADAFAALLGILAGSRCRLAWSRWYDSEAALAQTCFADDEFVVLDPADATNNVARTVRDWRVVRDRAAETINALKLHHHGDKINVLETKAAGSDNLNTLRAEVEAERSRANGLEERLDVLVERLDRMEVSSIRCSPTVQFDMSSQAYPRAGELMPLEHFAVAGMPEMKLRFYPNGEHVGASVCSLFLWASKGCMLKIVLYVDDVQNVGEHFYDDDRSCGFPSFCPIKPAYSRIGATLLQAAFVEPDRELSAAFEVAEDGSQACRVTWDISKARSLPKGQLMESAKFTADGVSSLSLEFFPSGNEPAREGQCSIFIQAPPCRMRYRLFVDEHENGPSAASDMLLTGGRGYSNFCPSRKSYKRVGVLIWRAEAARSPAHGVHVFS